MPAFALGQEPEIAPFRLTSIEGYMALRYAEDEQRLGSTGGVARERRSTWEEEVFVQTRSYIYHPNFLKFDLGAGPLFAQNRFESDAGSSRSNDGLYNLTARASFLEQKPYPFALYYEHLNPSVSVGLTQTFRQENDKYGFNLALRQPLTPILLTLDAFRLTTKGEGFDIIVDDTIDQATLRAHQSFGAGNYNQLMFQTTHQESLSGSPNLPIQPTTTDTDLWNLDSRATFGAQRQFLLTNIVSYTTQNYTLGSETPARRDLRVSPDLRWEHSPALYSFYRVNLLQSEERQLETLHRSAVAGLAHRPDDRWFTTTDVHAERFDATGFTQHTDGVAGSISYRRPIPVGSLQLSYAARYDLKDRDAPAVQVAIFGERITLADAIAVTLANDFIVPGTIVVRNLTRTQIYAEGLDYRVIAIGAKTQIQRLVAGNILDGQEVLVDYAYQTGGSVAYATFDQNLQTNLALFRYYNLFARYRDVAQDVRSGVPTLPLNPGRNTLYGARADVPVWREWMVGGEVTREEQSEDISPYMRRSIDTYVQLLLPYASTLRVAGRRVVADNLNSPEDVDLRGYSVLLRARPGFRATLVAEANVDKDIGGTIPREFQSRVLAAEWRYRQLSLRAEARSAREVQGGFERERRLIRVQARRDF